MPTVTSANKAEFDRKENEKKHPHGFHGERNPHPKLLPIESVSKEHMLRRGADGHLDKAKERYIPVSHVIGREPVPAASEGKEYRKGQAVTQPIEVAYDHESKAYHLYAGNHRIHQAELNGDSHIRAFVQPDKGIVGAHATTLREKTNLGRYG